MTDTTEIDVCVVGAGPVGASLACLLAARGVSVAIVDRRELPPMEHPDFDGRAYAIAAGSRADLLEPAGIWANLPLPSCPIESIRVSDGKLGRPASPLSLHFDESEAGAGPFGYMTEARSLRMALNRTLHQAGIDVLAPAEVTPEDVSAGRRTLRSSDGRILRARLVVAAEGRESRLREAAGIAVTRIAYRQSGIVSAIAHEHPHGNEALEHFLPAGPFAQLPMAATEGAENLSAIVWTEGSALAERMMGASDAIFAHEVRRRLGGHLGAVRPIGRRWLYKLSAMHAHRYVGERLALVGDAAHGIHPIAGQGLNLGLRDAIALAGLVADAIRAGGDPGETGLLERYQALRRPDDLTMLAATDLLDRLFSNDNPAMRLARDVGMAGVGRIGPLKRMFMRRAMGLSGGARGVPAPRSNEQHGAATRP
jgi:2-octaprenyl-6-methoxyphenol hydroxylase